MFMEPGVGGASPSPSSSFMSWSGTNFGATSLGSSLKKSGCSCTSPSSNDQVVAIGT